MILRSDHEPQGFGNWLSGELGTRKWAVSTRRLPGYTIGLSQKQYTALRHRWLGLVLARAMYGLPPPTGAPARVRVTDLLDTVPNPYDCDLDEAVPDYGDFVPLLAELRANGQALVGGGAAPSYMLQLIG